MEDVNYGFFFTTVPFNEIVLRNYFQKLSVIVGKKSSALEIFKDFLILLLSLCFPPASCQYVTFETVNFLYLHDGSLYNSSVVSVPSSFFRCSILYFLYFPFFPLLFRPLSKNCPIDSPSAHSSCMVLVLFWSLLLCTRLEAVFLSTSPFQ